MCYVKSGDIEVYDKPLGVAILVADSHLSSVDPNNTTNLVNMLNYGNKIVFKTSTLLNVGDYDENCIDYSENHPHFTDRSPGLGVYFKVVEEHFAKGQNITHAVCVGNHQYTHPGNDGVATPVRQTNFLINVSKHLNPKLLPNQKLVDENGNLQKTYYYTTDGVAHYIVLNPWEDASRALEYNFTKAQLEWLKSTLEYCKKDSKPVFVLNHIGLDESAMPGLTEVLSTHEKLIYFSGHTHIEMFNVEPIYKNGFWQVELPSTIRLGDNLKSMISGAYYMYIYENAVILRAVNVDIGEFVSEYNKVLKFNGTKQSEF